MEYMILSHGNLAKGMLDTVEMFIGVEHNIKAIVAYGEESVDYAVELKKLFEDLIVNEEECIIFTDIEGGSVTQKAIELIFEYDLFNKVKIISNMNLPVIIDVVLSKSKVKDRQWDFFDMQPQVIEIGQFSKE